MRTNFKNIEYFKKYIAFNNEDIVFYEEGLKSGTTKVDRIPAVNRQIFTTNLHTTIAKYSAGYPIPEIRNDLLKAIDTLKDGWRNQRSRISFDDYILMLWILSLSVLLDIDQENFKKSSVFWMNVPMAITSTILLLRPDGPIEPSNLHWLFLKSLDF